MKIGRVIGHVVLSQHIPEYKGGRWLLVSPLDKKDLLEPANTSITTQPSSVVYDNLGGSTGDLIGYTEGGEATLPFDYPMPVDSYNCCLFDQVNVYPEFNDTIDS